MNNRLVHVHFTDFVTVKVTFESDFFVVLNIVFVLQPFLANFFTSE